MNLGHILPETADFVALVDAIRANAEQRALMYKTEDQRHAFLERFVPLSFADFCAATANFSRTIGELMDEDQRLADELERQRRAEEDHDLDQRERYLSRQERQQRERSQRYEENEQAQAIRDKAKWVRTIDEEGRDNAADDPASVLNNIASHRRSLFEDREELLDLRARLADIRFTKEDPKFRPKIPVPGLRRFIDAGLGNIYSPTIDDYKVYLRSFDAEGESGYKTAVDSLTKESEFTEEIRNYHTLVVAPSGWGKSELLKQIIYHYIHHNSAGVLIIDPLGELAGQVRMWPEVVLKDRLVLVDPSADRTLTVGLNPFDGRGIADEEDRKALASEWSHIIGAITGDLSINMRRVTNNCIRVLLGWHKSATLMDLKYLLGESEQTPKSAKESPLDRIGTGQKVDPLILARIRRKGELQEFARNYPDAEIQDFFRNEFDTVGVSSTRQALRGRLDLLLQIPFAERLFLGEQTLDLRKELDAKKVVVVNLLPFGSNDNIKTIGSLFLGMIAAMGRKRGEEHHSERVPVQVVLDEASMIVSPVITEILTRLRKFRVHLTLAQQIDGDGFTYEQRRAMIMCTRCKLIAPDDADAVELLGLGKRKAKLGPLEYRQFYARWGDQAEPVRLSVRSELRDTTHTASDEEFRAHLDRGKAAGLYRAPYVAPVPVEEPAPALLPAPKPAAVDEPPAAADDKPVKRPPKATRKTSTGKPKLF